MNSESWKNAKFQQWPSGQEGKCKELLLSSNWRVHYKQGKNDLPKWEKNILQPIIMNTKIIESLKLLH